MDVISGIINVVFSPMPWKNFDNSIPKILTRSKFQRYFKDVLFNLIVDALWHAGYMVNCADALNNYISSIYNLEILKYCLLILASIQI